MAKVVSGHQSVGGCDRGESPYAQEYETPRHGSVNYAMACYQLWLYDGKSRETGTDMWGKRGLSYRKHGFREPVLTRSHKEKGNCIAYRESKASHVLEKQ